MSTSGTQSVAVSEPVFPQSQTDTLRIAIIGCGYWGPNHVRNFSSVPACKVSAVVDLDVNRLARIAQHFPSIAIYDDYRRVLEDKTVGGVVIATPTSTHYAIVRDALLAGKHVLCEKPLCESSEEGAELVRIAQERQLVLMVGHVFLFSAAVEALKRLLRSQELGRLYYLSSVRTNLGPIRNDVNAAYDLAAHDISILNWLLEEEPVSVSATGVCCLRPGIEDVVFISLRYPGNIYASIEASWLNPKKVRHLTLVGSNKMATWDDLELSTPIAVYDRGANAQQEYNDFGEFLRISMWNGDVRLPRIQMEEPLKVQSEEFVNVIRSRQPCRSDGAFGLGVVRTLEVIRASLQINGAPVQLARHELARSARL